MPRSIWLPSRGLGGDKTRSLTKIFSNMRLSQLRLFAALTPSLRTSAATLHTCATFRSYWKPQHLSAPEHRAKGGWNAEEGGMQAPRSPDGDRWPDSRRGNRFNKSSRFGGRAGRPSRRAIGLREPDAEDLKLIKRNRSHAQKDDGLRGLPPYDLDLDARANLDWNQLVSPDAEKVEGMSSVETLTLAEKRLLSLPLVNSLVYNRKYTKLTPVQAQTLLPILRNESVVVRAKTGTGKTAAFAIPAIQKVIDAKNAGEASNRVKTLIISPTRELAQQIADEIFKILDYGGLADISVQCLVGGLSKHAQIRAGGFHSDACVDIVVATPGRLNDVLEDPHVLEKFDSLQFRVFDEADRLLDIGFEPVLNVIRRKLDSVSVSNEKVPLLLFSATADAAVRNFARQQLGDRVRLVDTIPKDEPTPNELVDQAAVVCPSWADVYEGVARAICDGYDAAKTESKSFKAIVFMPTVSMVDNFERILRRLFTHDQQFRSNIMAIHGQKRQNIRQKRSDTFRQSSDAILITTDVVARGMDFPLVTHVYQLNVPTDTASYVHRIGRTARIGNRGKSFLYYTSDVRGYMNSLAREGIKPALKVYAKDDVFHEKFLAAVNDSLISDDEAHEVINAIMAYMSVLRSKYHINEAEFMRDMRELARVYGVSDLNVSRANSASWDTRRGPVRRGFGSNRKSLMRW